MKIYLVTGNENFADELVIAVASSRKAAEKALREKGYHLDRRQKLFVNSRSDFGSYAKISPMKVDDFSFLDFLP